MGQTTSITITNAPELTAAQLAEIADGHVYDTTAWTDEDGTHHVQGNSKWMPDELISAVVNLTEALPEATTTVDEEWDNRDADEPGQTISRYRAGALLPQASQVNGLVPGDLPTAIANVRAALAGDGDVTESVTWLLDGLDGTRV